MDITNIKRGVHRRIIKSMLIIGIFPLVMGLYLTYLDVTRALRNSIGEYFQEEAIDVARKVEMLIKEEVVAVQRLSISPLIRDAILRRNYDQKELHSYIKHFKNFDEKEVHSLLVVDKDGIYVNGINEKKKNYSKEKWFQIAYNNGRGRVYVSDLRYDNNLDSYFMNIASPVMENGRVIGFVVVKYTVNKLLEVINTVKIGDTGHPTLVDSTGTIIMCPIFPLRTHHVSGELISLFLNNRPGWRVVEDDAHGGYDSIIGFAPVKTTLLGDLNWIDGNRWYVFIRQSPREMYAPIYSLLLRVSLFGSVLIAFLSLSGIYAARKIVRPINELIKGVKLFREGRLNYRLNIKTDDEIEELADEFNNMAEELTSTYKALEKRKKELETSEERYKDLVENSPEMIHSVNSERYFVGVNKTELEILGYTIEEMRNKRLEDIVPPEYKNQIKRHVDRVIKDGKNRVESQFITKNGRKIDIEISATALYHPITQQFIKTRAFVRDITDRKRLERHLKMYHEVLEQKVSERTQELKETKEYLENLLEVANDVIFTLNSEGLITYVNKKIEDWGYKKEEIVGKSFFSLLSRKYQNESFRRVIIEGIRYTYEVEVLDKSGEFRYTVLSISPLKGDGDSKGGVLGIANDITERKRLEQQVAQAEKMSAIGQLAAGIAHEINNPLGGILNCLYNIRRKRLSKDREKEYLKSMEDGIQRVQRTVDQLLDFSQQHEPELTSVDINILVEEVLSLMNYAISKNGIRLEKDLDRELPRLMLDHHKMGQVVMNILLNAVQAIRDNGKIKIRTFQEDGWCCIAVTDNGAGIPPHILPRIFDPFFTTKDVGKGTGLGLAVSLGIVEKHAGKIDVKSRVGDGTTFIIRLPMRVHFTSPHPVPLS